ncbi:hypothetical protein IT408_02345 [Candidatus Uhrbacteria bacterium]|nr:hypothetical protein [Candidatus Uhrbacteria bacterium]
MSTRAFAIGMMRPHETLGIPQPLGRRLPQGIWAWNLTILVATLCLSTLYVFQVNAFASKGYELRNIEHHVESLKTEAMALQDKMTTLTTLQAVSERASALGFIQSDNVIYLNPAAKSYAVAK